MYDIWVMRGIYGTAHKRNDIQGTNRITSALLLLKTNELQTPPQIKQRDKAPSSEHPDLAPEDD